MENANVVWLQLAFFSIHFLVNIIVIPVLFICYFMKSALFLQGLFLLS